MERHSLHAEHHRFPKVLWSDGIERRFETRRCTKNMPWPLWAQHRRWPEGHLDVSVLKVWTATLPNHVTRKWILVRFRKNTRRKTTQESPMYLLCETIKSFKQRITMYGITNQQIMREPRTQHQKFVQQTILPYWAVAPIVKTIHIKRPRKTCRMLPTKLLQQIWAPFLSSRP